MPIITEITNICQSPRWQISKCRDCQSQIRNHKHRSFEITNIKVTPRSWLVPLQCWVSSSGFDNELASLTSTSSNSFLFLLMLSFWTLLSFYDIFLIRFILLSAFLSCSGNSAKILERCWMIWPLSDLLGTRSQSRRKRGWISYPLASRSTNMSVGRFWLSKWRLVPSGKLKLIRIYIGLLVLGDLKCCN